MQQTLYRWKAQDGARSNETVVTSSRSAVVLLHARAHSIGDTLMRWGLGHFRVVPMNLHLHLHGQIEASS